jgi:hypothetical protein
MKPRLSTSEQRLSELIFRHYLKRRAELDGDEHGPAALRLVATICGDDPTKLAQAVDSARASLASRVQLWDRVQARLSV